MSSATERLFRKVATASPAHFERGSTCQSSSAGVAVEESRTHGGGCKARSARPPRGLAEALSALILCASGVRDSAQRLPYSSWRRYQTPASLRPLGARSSHWYMPQRPSTPRAKVE